MKISRRSILQGSVTSAVVSLFGFTPKAQAAGKNIVKVVKIKVGATFPFELANGAPALLFRTKTGVFAYQLICTHQGGLAAYFAPSKLIVCPVHQASFNPFNAGKVVVGPAVNPLPRVKVKISGAWVVLA